MIYLFCHTCVSVLSGKTVECSSQEKSQQLECTHRIRNLLFGIVIFHWAAAHGNVVSTFSLHSTNTQEVGALMNSHNSSPFVYFEASVKGDALW